MCKVTHCVQSYTLCVKLHTEYKSSFTLIVKKFPSLEIFYTHVVAEANMRYGSGLYLPFSLIRPYPYHEYGEILSQIWRNIAQLFVHIHCPPLVHLHIHLHYHQHHLRWISWHNQLLERKNNNNNKFIETQVCNAHLGLLANICQFSSPFLEVFNELFNELFIIIITSGGNFNWFFLYILK